jgi:hypothetical protein|tara:strand:+ start:1269 stop:1544 length:276 start_codon:yes stop_codon:yes gene_type:complete
MMTKDEIKDMLKAGSVRIEFIKANGARREMNATLSEQIIVVAPVIEGSAAGTKKSNEFALPVWDVDAVGWRSFRWDSLRDVAGQMLPDGVK